MPVFTFVCASCKSEFRKILPARRDEAECKCGGWGARKLGVPSCSVYEHLDNGAMARAIDRPADAVKMFRERAEEHKKNFVEDVQDEDLEEINVDGDPVG